MRGYVESLTTKLHDVHKAATSDNTEVLRLQSALDAHDTTQTNLVQHKAKEASWSVLHAEQTCHFEEGDMRDG